MSPSSSPYCITVLQRNKTNRTAHTNTEIGYEALARVIMEADKSQTFRWASSLETQKEPHAPVESEGPVLENSLIGGKVGLFVLFRPSTDWMSPTYTVEGNLLYSKFTDLNAMASKNTLPETPRITFVSGLCIKLTTIPTRCRMAGSALLRP